MGRNYINASGKYGGIKFLPDGRIELSFFIPKEERQRLLRGIDEMAATGLPELVIEAGKRRKKRSIDANDYLWALCTRIAEELQAGRTMVTKEEVYRKHIREAGRFDALALQEGAVERFAEVWARNGTGWFTETVDSKLEGCRKVFAYYGSSTYDTEEMSRLIENVLEDCRALGIDTMPPGDMESLLEEWGKRH